LAPLGRAARWLVRGLGGATGAGVGVQTTPEGEDPLLRGLGGAVTGGVLGPMAASTLARGKGPLGKIRDFTYFSMLSSPDTIARGGFGAVGGAMSAGVELGLDGIMTLDPKKIARGSKILGSLATEGVGIWGKAMAASPEQFTRMQRRYLGEVGGVQEYTGGRGVGRLFSAPDMAAVNAMQRGGYSRAAAKRFTLTGAPQSRAGKFVLKFAQPEERHGPLAEFAATQSAPFARVGVLGLEKGLERLPLAGMFGKTRRKGAAGPGRTISEKLAQQATGTAAAGAGYLGEDYVDPRLSMVLGPLAGPAFLPLVAGREFRRQEERGRKGAGAAASTLGETVKELSPFGFQPFGLFTSTATELPRRIIPAGVADVARAIDPAFERERSVSALEDLRQRGEYAGEPILGPVKARLPGLREELPETFAPVDVFGRQRYATPEVIAGAEESPVLRGLLRTVAPALQSAEPAAMPESDPLLSQLRELGIELQPPSSRVTLPGTGLPLKQTAESARDVQALGGISPQLAVPIVLQLMSQPQFKDMPPARKRYYAQLLMRRIQGRLSRALSSARLATALSGGAQPPTAFTE
jgi:hypothetical protein